LGYPDTGMPYEESFLRRLYDGCRVSASRWGRTETWRPDGQDFHFMRSGCHSTYTAASVLRDLSDVLALVNPDTVYVTAPGDCHGDHDALGRFTTQAVAAMENPPALYYYLIHADRTDILIQSYTSQDPAAYNGYLLAFAKNDELVFRVERLPSRT